MFNGYAYFSKQMKDGLRKAWWEKNAILVFLLLLLKLPWSCTSAYTFASVLKLKYVTFCNLCTCKDLHVNMDWISVSLTVITPSVWTTKRLSSVVKRNLVRSVQSLKPTGNQQKPQMFRYRNNWVMPPIHRCYFTSKYEILELNARRSCGK